MKINFIYHEDTAPRIEAFDEEGKKIAEVFGLSKKHAKDNIKKKLGLKRDVDNIAMDSGKKKTKKKLYPGTSMLTGVSRNSKTTEWKETK